MEKIIKHYEINLRNLMKAEIILIFAVILLISTRANYMED